MKTISKKPKTPESNAHVDATENEAWDQRQLGYDGRYAEAAPEYKKTTASTITTIRMPLHLLNDLKRIAEDEGLPYQTLIKTVLTKFIRDKK
jgi:predicted DNA binding CopG/RHH family protein